MKSKLSTHLFTIIILITLFTHVAPVNPVNAAGADAWWDEDWPYRVQLTVVETGAAAVRPDFTALFAQLGLPGALLDMDSIRIIPYTNGIPGKPIPYAETLSTLIMDGESLNLKPAGSDPYWTEWDQAALSLDSERFTLGSSSIKAELLRQENLFPMPEFTYHFADTPISDWSAYETLIYDVLPEVNETAVDQATDLYQIEFLGLQLCTIPRINGPSLVMDQWNHTSTSLLPVGDCTTPDFSEMQGLRFFLSTQQPGGFDIGDRLTLWLDNFRLVDQDGEGEIRWIAEEQVDSYYLYFDTLNHTGHPEPEQMTFSGETFNTASTGEVEAGGYFSQVSGVTSADLTVWSAPTVEKIFKSQLEPISESPLLVQAARREFEAFQLVLQSTIDQNLPLNLSDLVGENATIPSSQIQVFRVDYIPLNQISDFYGRLVDWPDPLYPLTPGESIPLQRGENQPLWVRVEVPGNAPAGLYAGALTIGTTQIPFSLEVWDFSLPENAFPDASVGLDWDMVLPAYGASDPETPAACITQLKSAILDTLGDFHLSANPDLDGIRISTLTDYEVQEAHTYQLQTGSPVWWAFTDRDKPPFANPAVIDRPGLDARLLPSLAWLDRVDGLYYAQVVDWDSDPWTTPFSNDLSNGDGFLFYPPNNDSLGYDPCEGESNRLIPSIRLELFREGLEDYAYLYLLNGHAPDIGVENDGDLQLRTVAFSRTAFNRTPAAIFGLRQAVANLMGGEKSFYFHYFPYITQ